MGGLSDMVSLAKLHLIRALVGAPVERSHIELSRCHSRNGALARRDVPFSAAEPDLPSHQLAAGPAAPAQGR